jgi:two-component sensor histidine kinase/Tfp pilus assembly protein PilF
MEQIQRNKNARQAFIHDFRSYLLALSLISTVCLGQDVITDLKKELNRTSQEEVEERLILLNDLTWEYIYDNKDSALHYGIEALNLAKLSKEKYPKTVSNTYGTVAILFDIQGDNDRALELYLQSLEIKESIADSSGIATTKTNIGALFFTQEEYGRALPYFNDALEIETTLKDTLNQIGSLINISVIHKNQGNPALAKKYLLRALSLNKKIKDHEVYDGMIYNNLGAQFLYSDDLDSAEFYLSVGKDIHEEKGDSYGHSISLENLAKIYMRKGDVNKAKTTVKKALEIAQNNNYFLVQTNCFETLHEIYLVNGEIDSAIYYKSNYERLRDSTLTMENKMIVDELEAKYELRKKQDEILLKNQQIEEEKRSNNIYLFALISGGLFIIALFILIIQKVRGNNLLKLKNQTIQNSLNEKEILMREIHHRVKNNIQAIKSIINIQKRKSNSNEVKESLNETLNRVNAMAVIHNRLYQQENIASLTSDVYLQELLDDILHSFGISANDMIQSDFVSHPLPTDELLTLGLVFNEIITNACKYGKNELGQLELKVYSEVDSNTFTIRIKDSGPGLKDDKKGFGNNLVEALIHKMNGKINYLSSNGLEVIVEIPIHELKI